MFRDRTNLYISYRQSYAHHPQFSTSSRGGVAGPGFEVPEEEQFLMSQGDNSTDNAPDAIAIEMDVLPPAWLDISDQIDSVLEEIDEKVTKLGVLHKKNALPGFDDRADEEKQIEQLTYEITSDLHQCQSLIKRFESQTHNTNEKEAEAKMAENMKIRMATKVQATSTSFRKMQSNYLKSLRNEAFAENPSTGSGSTAISSNFLDDPGFTDETDNFDNLVNEQTYVQEDHIHQREQEINKIAQGIFELSTIFKDLQTMVIDQGTILDRIDYNIETTHTQVKSADKELIAATHYQKRTQKCKIILLLVLIVVGLFIVLLVKPKHHSGTPPPQPDEKPTPVVTTIESPKPSSTNTGVNKYLII